MICIDTSSVEKVKASMKERKNEFMPVIDEQNHIADVIFWEDLFQIKREKSTKN